MIRFETQPVEVSAVSSLVAIAIKTTFTFSKKIPKYILFWEWLNKPRKKRLIWFEAEKILLEMCVLWKRCRKVRQNLTQTQIILPVVGCAICCSDQKNSKKRYCKLCMQSNRALSFPHVIEIENIVQSFKMLSKQLHCLDNCRILYCTHETRLVLWKCHRSFVNCA